VWWPPCDIFFNRWEIYERDDPFYTYITALYYSPRLFTIHDIGPAAVLERMMFAIFTVIGCIINANIVGNFFVLIREMNAKPNEF